MLVVNGSNLLGLLVICRSVQARQQTLLLLLLLLLLLHLSGLLCLDVCVFYSMALYLGGQFSLQCRLDAAVGLLLFATVAFVVERFVASVYVQTAAVVTVTVARTVGCVCPGKDASVGNAVLMWLVSWLVASQTV
jgi:hypothetical protein